MKFPFKKTDNSSVWYKFGDIDLALLGKFLDAVPAGKRMEMIIREEVVWDAVQMKKYFEGPVVTFIHTLYAQQGTAVGEGNIREGLKGLFIGWEEPNEFGQIFAKSRTELDTPKDGVSPRERWKKFLRDINSYCQDTWGCELPTYDNTDTGD